MLSRPANKDFYSESLSTMIAVNFCACYLQLINEKCLTYDVLGPIFLF